MLGMKLELTDHCLLHQVTVRIKEFLNRILRTTRAEWKAGPHSPGTTSSVGDAIGEANDLTLLRVHKLKMQRHDRAQIRQESSTLREEL